MGDFHLSGVVVPSVTEVLLYVLCVCARTPLHASVLWPMSHRLFGAKVRSRLMGLSLLSAQRMCSLTGWLIKAPTQLFSHSQKKKKKKDRCMFGLIHAPRKSNHSAFLGRSACHKRLIMNFYCVALPVFWCARYTIH